MASMISSDDVTSFSGSLRHFVVTFPKQVNGKDLRELFNSLMHGEIDEEGDSSDVGATALLAVLFNESTPILDRYLACGSLELIAPQVDLCQDIQSSEVSQLVYAVTLILAQGPHDAGFKEIVGKLARSLPNKHIEHCIHQQFLAMLSRIPKHLLETEDTKKVTSLLRHWLADTATHQAPKSASRGKKMAQYVPITEIDGTPSRENFTVLSLARANTSDQFLHIQVFSMLFSWLYGIAGDGGQKNELLASLMPDELQVCIRDYCTQLLEQADRRPMEPSDLELQKACLTEAINLFDVVCQVNNSHVPVVLPLVRKIYDRMATKQPLSIDVPVIIAAAQFLFRNGNIIMHKVEDICPYVLRDMMTTCYHDDLAVHEVIKFVRDNLTQLCYQSSVLEKCFPSLLKALAWNPSALKDDFLELLPAFMSQYTSVELFYALLDLPCLTAALLISQVQEGSSQTHVDPLLSQHFSEPSLQPILNFVLRPSSGIGDTFNRVSQFHSAIESLGNNRRVVQCSQIVIPLLNVYFETFMEYADTSLTSLLFPAILERIGLLYPVGYINQVHRFVANTMPKLIELYPDILAHLQEEIVDYLSRHRNTTIATEVFTQMVWAVGEYACTTYSAICGSEVAAAYYEGLESTTYEMLVTPFDSKERLRLACVAVTTLAKLATRCQDLLSRAILCLSKVAQHAASSNDGNKHIVVGRIEELLSILRTPNVASLVLTPSKEIYSGKWHRDATSLPCVLRTITLLTSDKVS